ncbi:MAG: OmpA family protein [Deltaproteobacteria bacterium]|nr:OmpA family protein [Deltaproteobacteria bacterium]
MRITLLLIAVIVLSSCAMNKATQGTLAGGAIGAGTGAIIGSATGHAGAGTAIGAGIGAVSGALIGNAFDQQDEQNRRLESDVERQQAIIDENRRLIEELKRGGADVYSSKRGVVVNLPDVLFAFDRADLTSAARKTVHEIAKVANKTGRTISVEGHTDNVGTTLYNEKLSINRAESVAKELEKNNVSPARLRVRGFGEGYPIATNNTDAGRSRNRRVEVIFENDSYEARRPVNNPDSVPEYNTNSYPDDRRY